MLNVTDFVRKKILIVEDDNVLRAVLVEKLQPEFSIIEAGSGEVALVLIAERRPDAVLLDLMLPNLSGFEFLERIRASPDPFVSKVKIIVLTNLEGQEYINKATQFNLLGYFIKSSIDINEFSGKVIQLLDAAKSGN